MKRLIALITIAALPMSLAAQDDAPKEVPEAKTWVSEQSARVGGKNIDYTVFGDVFGAWDWSHAQPDLQGFKLPMPNTSIDLAMAMKQNPSMIKYKADLAQFIKGGASN